MARLAIIGGGASGLMTAHRLQNEHDVTVFEKEAQIGGNVRTLNANVFVDRGPKDLRLECGVLGFHQHSSPVLHALLGDLNIDLSASQPSTSIYHNGHYFPARAANLCNRSVLLHWLRHPSYASKMARLKRDYAAGFQAISRYVGQEDPDLGTLLGLNPILDDFIRSLLALAFSTPFSETDRLPVSLIAPYFRSLRQPDWSYVRGGVASYLMKIVGKGRFELITDAGEVRLDRTHHGVRIHAKGQTMTADAVVLATTPGQVLNIVTDADELERNWFKDWSDRHFTTILHSDEAIYHPYKRTPRTPMDLFVNHQSSAFGYNTSLSEFCGLPEHARYGFAYGLDNDISTDAVIYRCQHTVPVYTAAALRTRKDLIANMGRRGLFFAGAWLDNGLHEGAAVSAKRTAQCVLSNNIGQQGPLAAAV